MRAIPMAAAAAALALAGATVSGPAAAQGAQPQRAQQQTERTQPQQQQRRIAQQRQGARTQQQPQGPSVVMGELVGLRDVQLQGGAEHRLLRLRTPQGRTVVVDIGQVGAYEEGLNLQRGERVIAVGKPGRINQMPVLYAVSVGELYGGGRTTPQQQQRGTSRRATAEIGQQGE